jgi:Cu(I)/Ag(I) efflux system membrane protein CusA/SilA
MKRIAAPMVGGIFTSFLLELLAYPAIYELWKRKSLGLKAPEKVPSADRRLVSSGESRMA